MNQKQFQSKMLDLLLAMAEGDGTVNVPRELAALARDMTLKAWMRNRCVDAMAHLASCQGNIEINGRTTAIGVIADLANDEPKEKP